MFGGAEPPHCGLRRRHPVSQRSLLCAELHKQGPWRGESITEAPKGDGGCKLFSQLLKDLPSLARVGSKTEWFEDLFWWPWGPQICSALWLNRCSTRLAAASQIHPGGIAWSLSHVVGTCGSPSPLEQGRRLLPPPPSEPRADAINIDGREGGPGKSSQCAQARVC